MSTVGTIAPWCPWCEAYHGGPRCWPQTDHFAQAMRQPDTPRDDMYCLDCDRYHGQKDERHDRATQLWTWQQFLWSDDYQPAPVYPKGPACGDCEQMPCRCEVPDNIDLAWLPRLADHDDIAGENLPPKVTPLLSEVA